MQVTPVMQVTPCYGTWDDQKLKVNSCKRVWQSSV